MQHLDEGTIHAWLDGELPPEERAALEAHIAECEQCAAAVAEARGFIAASSRILTALDSVPGGVIPAASTAPAGLQGVSVARPVRRPFVASRAWMAVAAVLVLSTVTVIAVRPGSQSAQLRVARATRDEKEIASSAAPSLNKGVAPANGVQGEFADSNATAKASHTSPAPIPATAPVAAAGGATSANAPAVMRSLEPAPAAASKPVDQSERLKTRLQSERQSTRVRPSADGPNAMAAAAAPARAVDSTSTLNYAAKQPVSPPSASRVATDLAEKREDAAAASDSLGSPAADKSASAITITGRVTSDAGAPVVSASVALGRTGIVTLSRGDGSYALVIPESLAKRNADSLFVRSMGFKPAVVPVTLSGSHLTRDFVLPTNALALTQTVITGEGTTRTNEKLGASVSEVTTLPDGEHAGIVSRTSAVVSGEPVEITTYRVGGENITLVDRLRPDTTKRALDKKVRSPLERVQGKTTAATNSITWTDSAGRIRTLRGAVSQDELERLKEQLFGATP